jgi:hypothetical protein
MDAAFDAAFKALDDTGQLSKETWAGLFRLQKPLFTHGGPSARRV